MSKFIKVTSAEDDTTIVVNAAMILKVFREEDDDHTTIVMSDDYADLEVTESPSKVYSLLTRVPSQEGTVQSKEPDEPSDKDRAISALQDQHMVNLSRHADNST